MSSPATTAISILDLSNATSKLRTSLPELFSSEHTQGISLAAAPDGLALELRSLEHECSMLYLELDKAIKKGGQELSTPHDIDMNIWTCVALQLKESLQHIQGVERFLRGLPEHALSTPAEAQKSQNYDPSSRTALYEPCLSEHASTMRSLRLLVNM